MDIELTPRQAGGGMVTRTKAGWRLEIPAGSSRIYRLAQLDDYAGLPRCRLKHAPSLTFNLRARLSANNLPGTWGFGLWNDPFGFSFVPGTPAGRLPALPQAAWLFNGSPPNYLSLNNTAPANGFFAGTYRSPRLPSLLFAPGLLALPLFIIRPISRLMRRMASRIIRQDTAAIDLDVSEWHMYSIYWNDKSCTFRVDGNEILSTHCSPCPPLGLVLWIDNQFAAWTPQGQFGYGTLENPTSWLEIENLSIQQE